MFSDPLVLKKADTVTSAGSDESFAWIGGTPGVNREYRNESTGSPNNWETTIRTAVYPSGTGNRYVVSLRAIGTDATSGEKAVDNIVSVSISGEMIDEDSVANSLKKLAYMLVETGSGGLMARFLDGEY